MYDLGFLQCHNVRNANMRVIDFIFTNFKSEFDVKHGTKLMFDEDLHHSLLY